MLSHRGIFMHGMQEAVLERAPEKRKVNSDNFLHLEIDSAFKEQLKELIHRYKENAEQNEEEHDPSH